MRKWFYIISFMLLLLSGCTEVSTSEGASSPNGTWSAQKKTKAIAGETMQVSFINVGQGDSILIQSPNGKSMLVDAGVKGEGKTVVEYIRQEGIKQLNYVVATHPDADHIGGIVPVLNSISVKNFIDSGKAHTSQTYENMIQLVADKNIAFKVPKTGDKISLDKDVDVEVLFADEGASDNNEASIVLMVTYGDVRFLLMADAGSDVENEIMARSDVSATILKAGHHGSNTSSSQTFLRTVSPEATILSYGQDNKYGHPHYEVTHELQQLGSKVYGTAEAGTIVVTTDGVDYSIDAAEWTGVGATSSIASGASGEAATDGAKSGQVEIVAKDLDAELVTIKNNSSETVSLAGWSLVSVEGAQIFNFPNISLTSGKSISVSSGPNAMQNKTTLEWTKRQIWLNSGDAAQLVDAKGEIVSEAN